MRQASESDLRGLLVAITGGAGFVGPRVAVEASKLGAIVRSVSLHDDASCDVSADLTDLNATRRALDEADLVVHLAARSGGIGFQSRPDWSVWTDNVTVTSNVLRVAAEHDVKRVFLASSAAVYEASDGPPFTEDHALIGQPDISPYAWSKVCDELAGRWFHDHLGLEVVVGRFTTLYGPRDQARIQGATVIEDLARRAADAGPDHPAEVWGDGSQTRSFLHVADAAKAVLTIVMRGQAGLAYNVDNGEAVTIGDLAKQIVDRVQSRTRLTFNPSRPSGARYRVLNPARLQGLGFAPEVSLEEGLDDLLGQSETF